jgi:hypothetical protein
MARRAILAVVLAAAALLAGLATPAHADQVSAACEVQGFRLYPPVGYTLRLDGTAYYGPVTNAPGLRTWTRFRYKLGPKVWSGPDITGGKSNVNIRLYEGARLVREIKSPNDRVSHVWYEVTAPFPTFTHVGTGAPHDHRSDDVVRFEGIFDLILASDPRCTASTGRG